MHTLTLTENERSIPDKAHPNSYFFVGNFLLVRKVEWPLSSWCVLADAVLHDDDDEDNDDDDIMVVVNVY